MKQQSPTSAGRRMFASRGAAAPPLAGACTHLALRCKENQAEKVDLGQSSPFPRYCKQQQDRELVRWDLWRGSSPPDKATLRYTIRVRSPGEGLPVKY